MAAPAWKHNVANPYGGPHNDGKGVKLKLTKELYKDVFLTLDYLDHILGPRVGI